MWKLRGIRRGLEKGRCPLCWGEEDAKHWNVKNLKSRGKNGWIVIGRIW
jgi:hypothetical protein